MFSRKASLLGLIIFTLLSIVFAAAFSRMFYKTYYSNWDISIETRNDPRWRVFDYNSRQATEDEIYNVAEIPVVKKVTLDGTRKLLFEFSPEIKTDSWTIISKTSGKPVFESTVPVIQFPDSAFHDTFIFKPRGKSFAKEIEMTLWLNTAENNVKNGLSWPDNYWRSHSTVPFSTAKPYSVSDWTGFKGKSPEIKEAQKIIEGFVDMNAPSIVRSGQVFRFIIARTRDSGGYPTDKVQSASPLNTYKILSSGEGKGWCENIALVYYIFANASGVKTRIVDVAGKFGPLKLTGHYFCESWIPEEAKWIYVDPQMRVASVANPDSIHLNALELKKACDTGLISSLTANIYNAAQDSFRSETGSLTNLPYDYLNGDIVMAYKFGYGNNKGQFKIVNFVKYTTLLYAPFPTPKLYIFKIVCLWGLLSCPVIAILFFGFYRLNRIRKRTVNQDE